MHFRRISKSYVSIFYIFAIKTISTMKINSELEIYIYEEIIPQYSSFDSAHREDHAMTVISQAMKLADDMEDWKLENNCNDEIWKTEIDRNMLFTAAACHDLGLANGRDRHHLDSGTIIRSDNMLKKWFSEEQIETIAQAAEDHRASGKAQPRSIYGMIVAEADRVINGETIIRRTIQFGFNHYPSLTREEHIGRAIGHLREKYGRGGYLKLWIPWSDNTARLEALQDIIADDIAVREEVERILKTLE